MTADEIGKRELAWMGEFSNLMLQTNSIYNRKEDNQDIRTSALNLNETRHAIA